MRAEVTWLRKTPIMGNNLYEAVHKQQKHNTERQHVAAYADTYVPGPPYCTHGLRVPASGVP